MVMYPLAVAPLFPQLIASRPIMRGLLWCAAAVGGLMLTGIILCSSETVRNSRLLSDTVFKRFPLGRYVERTFDTIHAYRRYPGTLLAAFGISLLAHAMSIGVILLAVHATNPMGATWEMPLLIPIGFLANTLPITPGGLGVGEAVFAKLFSLAGLAGGAEALLVWRVLTMLLGLIGLAFYMQGRKRFVHEWPLHSEALPSHQNLRVQQG